MVLWKEKFTTSNCHIRFSNTLCRISCSLQTKQNLQKPPLLSFNQTSPPLDSTQRAQNKNGPHLIYPCRSRSTRLTSVEKTPALCILRSSHGAASWSVIWATAEGLPKSWLSNLRVGEQCCHLSCLAVGAAGLFPAELMMKSRIRLWFSEASLLISGCCSQYEAELIILKLLTGEELQWELKTMLVRNCKYCWLNSSELKKRSAILKYHTRVCEILFKSLKKKSFKLKTCAERPLLVETCGFRCTTAKMHLPFSWIYDN